MPRRYPVLESKVGAKLPATATKRTIVKAKPAPRKHTQLQKLLETTVQTLLLTAAPTGELAFRADINAAVFNDLSVDVTFWNRKLVVTFYSEDPRVRKLLLGYRDALLTHLQNKRFKVKDIRVLNAPDPNEAPPVPVT